MRFYYTFHRGTGLTKYLIVFIGEDGIFFRGGAGPQFSPRRGRDFSTKRGARGGLSSGILNMQILSFTIIKRKI